VTAPFDPARHPRTGAGQFTDSRHDEAPGVDLAAATVASGIDDTALANLALAGIDRSEAERRRATEAHADAIEAAVGPVVRASFPHATALVLDTAGQQGVITEIRGADGTIEKHDAYSDEGSPEWDTVEDLLGRHLDQLVEIAPRRFPNRYHVLPTYGVPAAPAETPAPAASEPQPPTSRA
jgi:hypothetical protein